MSGFIIMQLCNMLFVIVVVFRKVVCKSNDIFKKTMCSIREKKDQKSGLFLPI